MVVGRHFILAFSILKVFMDEMKLSWKCNALIFTKLAFVSQTSPSPPPLTLSSPAQNQHAFSTYAIEQFLCKTYVFAIVLAYWVNVLTWNLNRNWSPMSIPLLLDFQSSQKIGTYLLGTAFISTSCEEVIPKVDQKLNKDSPSDFVVTGLILILKALITPHQVTYKCPCVAVTNRCK